MEYDEYSDEYPIGQELQRLVNKENGHSSGHGRSSRSSLNANSFIRQMLLLEIQLPEVWAKKKARIKKRRLKTLRKRELYKRKHGG